MVEGEKNLQPTMSALAILTCRPNSHPFQERHISLTEPIKVGRSVARARPAANNGIFDCKVLSRNHALLWYENGTFYLQDTKSSNGTFVNNQRLCKGGEESAARDIFSGDLIQFGVDVMENNRRGDKITHGCIISTITLYHSDGREAKASPFMNAPNTPGITIQSQDLYQLAQYLQEALHREKMLEEKLITLQQLVQNTQEASESGWQALIDEDKLLSRLEVLENQLHIYSKNHSEDTLRQECVTLQEEKLQYEKTAKESLQTVIQEKLEAVTKLSELERSLSNSENECGHLNSMCEHAQKELYQLAEKYQEQLKSEKELQDKLKEMEEKLSEECDRAEQEKQEMTEKLEQMLQQEQVLSTQIESLQTDGEMSKEQLTTLKAKLDYNKELNDDDIDKISINDIEVSCPDIIPIKSKEIVESSLEGKLKETHQQIEKYKAQIAESDQKFNEKCDQLEELQKDLEQSQLESKHYKAKVTGLEEEIKLSDLHMNQMMEHSLADMKLQLTESQKQCETSDELIQSLRDEILSLEEELSGYKVINDKNSTSQVHVENKTCAKEVLGSTNQVQACTNQVLVSTSSPSSSTNDGEQNWQELLAEARSAQLRAETELQKNVHELSSVKKEIETQNHEMVTLKAQLKYSNKLVTEKSEHVTSLQGDLEAEKCKYQKSQTEIDDSKQKVKHLQNEMELERKEKRAVHVTRHANVESYTGQHTTRNKEFMALKEECANLRKRIQAIEAEMKMSRRENLQLSSEYNKLQESYRQLEALKKKMENNEMTWQVNLTDAQKDAENTKYELTRSSDSITALQVQCKEYSEKVSCLTSELTDMSGNYDTLLERSKLVSFVSSIPLLFLLFGFLMALYPTLSDLTFTNS